MFTLPNLPVPVSFEIYADLCQLLPEYPDDTADSRAHRAAVAMAGVADLHPTDAFQARLAAQTIAADAHIVLNLSRARRQSADFDKQRQCLAQAASMMREMKSFHRSLLDRQRQRQQPAAGARLLEEFLRDCYEQDTRLPQPECAATAETAQLEPLPDATPSALPVQAAAEAAAAALAADLAQPDPTLADPPPAADPSAATSPAIASAAPHAGPAEPPALRLVATAPAEPPAEAPADPVEIAEDYALKLGLHATMIRADGGLSPRVRSLVAESRLPSDPAVIHALVHGDSAILRVLDEMAPLLKSLEEDDVIPLAA